MNPDQQQQLLNQILRGLELLQGALGITYTDSSETAAVNGTVFVTRTVTISDGKNTITLINDTQPVKGDPAELKAKLEEQQASIQNVRDEQIAEIEKQKAVLDSVIATPVEVVDQKVTP